MDKLKALYNSYIEQGILSSQTTFEKFSLADSSIQENLYQQGIDNKVLSSQTDINTFQSAWGEVKKKDESVSISQEDVTESVTPTEQEEVISSDVSETISPKERKGVRLNFDEDGNVVGESTHLMKREFIPEEGWVAFPSLFQAWIAVSFFVSFCGLFEL